VKPVEHVNRIASFLGNHFQIRLPHVAADELQSARTRFAQHAEESQKSLGRAILADPQQPLRASVDLVDQR